MTCRTRFAPSPSGDLHVGGAEPLCSVGLWPGARRCFLLRIEDTDQKLLSDAASWAFSEICGGWGSDGTKAPKTKASAGETMGPYFQSQRLSVYQEHLQRLIDAGMAYPAFETGEELTAAEIKPEPRAPVSV